MDLNFKNSKKYKNIVEGNKEELEFKYEKESALNWLDTSDADFGKFLEFHKQEETPYHRAKSWSQLKEGVVLDFGCAIGWGVQLLKTQDEEIEYIGADIKMNPIAVGSLLYPEANYFYYLQRPFKKNFMKAITDSSVDLLIVSLLTLYKPLEIILDEWLRILKPDALFYFETHTFDYFSKEEKLVIYDFLKSNFDVKRIGGVMAAGRCLEDFLEEKKLVLGKGTPYEKEYKARIVALFQKKTAFTE